MSRFTIELKPDLDDMLEDLCERFDRQRLDMIRALIKSTHSRVIKKSSEQPHTCRQGPACEKATCRQMPWNAMDTCRQGPEKKMPIDDAPAGPRDSDSGSSKSSLLSEPDRPDPKPMPLWKAEIQEPRAQAFIELGIGAWPRSGPLAGFDNSELAGMVYSAWAVNPDCDPIDVVKEALSEIEGWLNGKRKRRNPGTLKTQIHRRIRQNAANAKERTAKQQARIEQAIKAGEQVRADRDDDPLLAQEERKARGEI